MFKSETNFSDQLRNISEKIALIFKHKETNEENTNISAEDRPKYHSN